MLTDYFDDATQSSLAAADAYEAAFARLEGGGGGGWEPNFFDDGTSPSACGNADAITQMFFSKVLQEMPSPPSLMENDPYLSCINHASSSTPSSSSTSSSNDQSGNESSSVDYDSAYNSTHENVSPYPCVIGQVKPELSQPAPPPPPAAIGIQKTRIQSRSKKGSNASLRMSVLDKKKRHRDLEISRRQKMNQKFEELGTLCNAAKKDKGSILESAKLRLDQHQAQMESVLQILNPVMEFTNLMEPSVPIEEDLKFMPPVGATNLEADTDDTESDLEQMSLDHPQEELVKFVIPCGSPVPLAELSSFGSLNGCNGSFAELFGVPASQMAGVSLFSLVAVNDLSILYTKFEEILSRHEPSFTSFSCSFSSTAGYFFYSRCVLSSFKPGLLQLMLVPSRL
eukprot:TRINITY_DN344_c0_g1_i2.p1 TRINITY_DN344_c0_g1~~TRINITY_DN344_c0_g1_i2.p1  ORF type:complete len:398 (-),score=85.87 TRINITY_DN344_c0_g1_i2:817-2010(-)